MSEDVEFPCNSDIPPAVPDGDHYQLMFDHAEKTNYRRQEKVYLWFRMLTAGEHSGQLFYTACNVPAKGKWTASCKFWCLWVFAAGQRPTRADRMMSMKVFRNKVFRARMRTVTKTANQPVRTPAQRYSVVDDLLEILVGK